MFLSFITLTAILTGVVHSQTWSTVGAGVQYRAVAEVSSVSNNVLITYAGHLVDTTTVWTDRLLLYSLLNETAYGVRHAYSVKGPRTVTYSGLEIENSKLLTHLYSLVSSPSANKPRLIVVVAHSSGCYVADEMFTQLYNRINANPNDAVYKAIQKRIVYYNLDGATTPSRKDSVYIRTLFANVNFVWASKGSLRSMNSASMIAAPGNYPTGLGVKSIEVPCPKADCLNNKCLHDAVIIEAPWDPNNYDLYRDYTLFSVNGREVQSAYMKVADLMSAINAA